MELKKMNMTSKELEIEITDDDETMLNPIVQTLLQNKDVEYAEYREDHPESKKRYLFLRVKKGSPEEILKKTVTQLEKEIADFLKSIEDQTKSK